MKLGSYSKSLPGAKRRSSKRVRMRPTAIVASARKSIGEGGMAAGVPETRFNVPVGLIACGIGATSVREWLPSGATFPNPPTIESRVEKRPDGSWASKGAAYAMFVARMKQAGPRGFRAVLWHQGESDANQKDPSRTLPGRLYRAYLERIIRDSRRDIGWEAPWFVAQSNDKKRVRLNIITHFLSKVPYEEIKRAKVVLPKRQSPGKYKEPDYPYKYVPAVF